MRKSNKVTDKEFKKLLKEHTPKKLINWHCNLKINLTAQQLNQLLKMKKD